MTCIVHCDLLLATGVMLGCFASLPLDFYVSGVALVEDARFPAFLFEILRAFQDAQLSWDVSARVGQGTSPTLYFSWACSKVITRTQVLVASHFPKAKTDLTR